MSDRTIPQRELRNNVGEILREAEAGTTFTVTVRGRPVARLGPEDDAGPRVEVDRATIRRLLAPPADPDFARDLDEAEDWVSGSERLQVLVRPEQRRRLEAEAKRRATSVGALIREAVDAWFGAVSREDRLEALAGIEQTAGRFLTPAELDRVVEEERDAQADAIPGPG